MRETEELSFEENLADQKEALTQEFSDRLKKLQKDTGVADLYVANTFAQSALLRALDIALEKENAEPPANCICGWRSSRT